MFLLPLSVLVTALGIAPTEDLKTGVSFIGVAISVAWFLRILFWKELSLADWLVALAFAVIFFAASAVSSCVHLQARHSGQPSASRTLR